MATTQSILITGGAGFIGSNFILDLLASAKMRVINLDNLTYGGNPANLATAENDPRYTFVRGDICDLPLVCQLFASHRPGAVVHLAAESHVDRSIHGADDFIRTNIQTRILRNRHFMIVKNLPAPLLLWLLPYLVVTELAIPPFFLVRSPKSLWEWFAAWIKLVRALPEVLRKRSRIQKSRKVDPLYLKQYFVRF